MIHFRPTHGIHKEARCLGAIARTHMAEKGNEPRGAWLEQLTVRQRLHERVIDGLHAADIGAVLMGLSVAGLLA